MNKFLYILLLPIFLFGQGVDPNKKIQTFNNLYALTSQGFYSRQTIPQTNETATVLDAKNYLWLDESINSPIYFMKNHRLVPKYALTSTLPIPVLTATGSTSSSITLAFTDPIGGAISSTIRYVRYFEYGQYWQSNTGSQTSPRTITGLNSNTTYVFQIQLIYPGGIYGPWSNEVWIATSNINQTDNYPTAPVLSLTGVTSSSVSLSWTASTDDFGILDYTITAEIWDTFLLEWIELTPDVVVSNSTFVYTWPGLLSARNYRFQVLARDTKSQSTASNTVSVSTLGSTPTVGITLTAVTNTYYKGWEGISINLNWNVPSTPGQTVHWYHLWYRNTTVGAPWRYLVLNATQEGTTNPNISMTFYSYRSRFFDDTFEFYIQACDLNDQPWSTSNTVSDNMPVGKYYLGFSYWVLFNDNLTLYSDQGNIDDYTYTTVSGETYTETTTYFILNNILEYRQIKSESTVSGFTQTRWTTLTPKTEAEMQEQFGTRTDPYLTSSFN